MFRQRIDHSYLRLEQQHESIALRLVSSCTADSVDVRADVLGAVELDHPVDSGEIDSSSRNIGAEEHGLPFFYKLKVDSGTLVLVLLSMQLEQVRGQLERLEGEVGESHLLDGGHEDKNFRLLVRLDEREESV